MNPILTVAGLALMIDDAFKHTVGRFYMGHKPVKFRIFRLHHFYYGALMFVGGLMI